MPLISCHLVYNSTKYLDKAIKSILNQTFKDFELILVADKINCIDFEHKQIKHFQSQGLFEGRNLALQKSDSKYVAVMDADDISLSNRFEEQIKLISDYDWLGFSAEEIDKQDNYLRTIIKSKTNDLSIHPSVIFKRSDLTIYPTDWPVAGDVGLWVKLKNANAKVGNCPKVLIKKRSHFEQITRSLRNLQSQAAKFYLKQLKVPK